MTNGRRWGEAKRNDEALGTSEMGQEEERLRGR